MGERARANKTRKVTELAITEYGPKETEQNPALDEGVTLRASDSEGGANVQPQALAVVSKPARGYADYQRTVGLAAKQDARHRTHAKDSHASRKACQRTQG
jgi:hypothetical protein